MAAVPECGPITVRNHKLSLWFPPDSSLVLIYLYSCVLLLWLWAHLGKVAFPFAIETFNWLKTHLITCSCWRVQTPCVPTWSRHSFLFGSLCTFPLLRISFMLFLALNSHLIPLFSFLDYSFCSHNFYKSFCTDPSVIIFFTSACNLYWNFVSQDGSKANSGQLMEHHLLMLPHCSQQNLCRIKVLIAQFMAAW